MPGADLRSNPFEHVGLLYRSEGEYVDACTGFVRRALSADDPVLVAVPGRNGALISDALGSEAGSVRAGSVEAGSVEAGSVEAGDVTYVDMAEAGRNPGRIMPWVLMRFARDHPDRKVWIIGEPIWPGRTGLEYPACVAHEALINTAFAGREAAILCPYDAANLDPEAVEDAWRTHPRMADAGGARVSDAYGDPVATAAGFDRPLPEPPADAETARYAEPGDLARLRAMVSRVATGAGLAVARVAELVVAVSELATNSLKHTAERRGTLTVWVDHGEVVCQIDDGGRLGDPMIGRLPPAELGSGLGLILVNHLVDLLRVHGHGGGTSFRIHMRATSVAGG